MIIKSYLPYTHSSLIQIISRIHMSHSFHTLSDALYNMNNDWFIDHTSLIIKLKININSFIQVSSHKLIERVCDVVHHLLQQFKISVTTQLRFILSSLIARFPYDQLNDLLVSCHPILFLWTRLWKGIAEMREMIGNYRFTFKLIFGFRVGFRLIRFIKTYHGDHHGLIHGHELSWTRLRNEPLTAVSLI